MKIVPYDKSKIEGLSFYSKGSNYAVIEEFVESDLDCVEVLDFKCKKPEYCSSSLQQTIDRYRINGVKAMTRKGHVFLLKIKD